MTKSKTRTGQGHVLRWFMAMGLCAPLLAGCGGVGGFSLADINPFTKFSSFKYGVNASPRVTNSRYIKKGGGRSMLGQPYKVAGRWYTPTYDPNYDKVGKASWYGPNFHGRLTANGEIFDQYALTAAHPTMPLPSYARVTNMANGNSVIVRVNDRGPFVPDRMIDVSRVAAEMLGFHNQGVEDVRVQYVGPAPVQGDDTRILMASFNARSPLDNPGNSDFSVAYAETAPMSASLLAFDAVLRPASPGESQPVALLSYLPPPVGASSAGEMIGNAIDAADAMAQRPGALKQWQAGIDEAAREINLPLGVFAMPQSVERVSLAFALLGAVEQDSFSAEGQLVTRLTLTHLRPGVQREDVIRLARELGLNDVRFRQ